MRRSRRGARVTLGSRRGRDTSARAAARGGDGSRSSTATAASTRAHRRLRARTGVRVAVGRRAAASNANRRSRSRSCRAARGERMDSSCRRRPSSASRDRAGRDRAHRRAARGRARGAARAHWRAVAVAACEQCGRARIPALAEPDAVRFATRGAAGGVAHPARAGCGHFAGRRRARRPVDRIPGRPGGRAGRRRTGCGRSPRAIAHCRLGPRVLRSETAAIAALAVLQAVAGDFV